MRGLSHLDRRKRLCLLRLKKFRQLCANDAVTLQRLLTPPIALRVALNWYNPDQPHLHTTHGSKPKY